MKLKDKLGLGLKMLLLSGIWAGTSCSKKPSLLALKEVDIKEIHVKTHMDMDGPAHKKLEDWLMTDSTTVTYDFPLLTDYLNLRRIVSEDGKICIYSWQDELECYRNVIQIAGEDGFHAYPYGVMALADEENEDQKEGGCMTTTIHQLNLDEGGTIYLTHSYGHPLSDYCNERHVWAVFYLDGNRLVPAKDMFVDEKGEEHDCLHAHLGMADWYVRNPEGPSTENWHLYDDRQHVIGFPIVDVEERMLDRYMAYTFDGEKFCQNEVIGNPCLHKDLQDYDELEHVYQAGELYVRIDRIGKDRYRYASWQHKDMENGALDMRLRPDIILDNGVYDEDRQMFCFHDGSYGYHVPEMMYSGERRIHAEPVHPAITITAGGETVREYRID